MTAARQFASQAQLHSFPRKHAEAAGGEERIDSSCAESERETTKRWQAWSTVFLKDEKISSRRKEEEDGDQSKLYFSFTYYIY